MLRFSNSVPIIYWVTPDSGGSSTSGANDSVSLAPEHSSRPPKRPDDLVENYLARTGRVSDVSKDTIANLDFEKFQEKGGDLSIFLTAGVETWAAARNAKEIMIYDTSGIAPQLTQRFARHVGFLPVGYNFAKTLK